MTHKTQSVKCQKHLLVSRPGYCLYILLFCSINHYFWLNPDILWPEYLKIIIQHQWDRSQYYHIHNMLKVLHGFRNLFWNRGQNKGENILLFSLNTETLKMISWDAINRQRASMTQGLQQLFSLPFMWDFIVRDKQKSSFHWPRTTAVRGPFQRNHPPFTKQKTNHCI